MKMLMILSRDRSNHTIICVQREEEEEEGDGEKKEQSQSNLESPGTTQRSDTLRKLCPSHVKKQPFLDLGSCAQQGGDLEARGSVHMHTS